jgi:hypothetical protein
MTHVQFSVCELKSHLGDISVYTEPLEDTGSLRRGGLKVPVGTLEGACRDRGWSSEDVLMETTGASLQWPSNVHLLRVDPNGLERRMLSVVRPFMTSSSSTKENAIIRASYYVCVEASVLIMRA